MSNILHSPIEVREEYHKNSINSIQKIIEKLEKMKQETMEYRCISYDVQIEYNNDIDYQIEYFKRAIELSNLDNSVVELTRIIKMQHDIIQKHQEYLARIDEQRSYKRRRLLDGELRNGLDLVSGIGSDAVLN